MKSLLDKPEKTIPVYKPSFLDRIIEGNGIEEAKKRVNFVGGRYHYIPSEEYKKHRAIVNTVVHGPKRG